MGKVKITIGITFIIIGAIMTALVFTAVPGIILIVIGVFFILFNKSEEKIEQRKDLNKSPTMKRK